MSKPIGFHVPTGTLVIMENGEFPAGSLVAYTHPTWADRIQIDTIAGRGAQTVPWPDVTSLDGTFTPASMADALAYLTAEFAKRPAVSFSFTQAAPLSAWTIRHGLGFRPNVSVIDSAGDLCLADVAWPDDATVLVTFGAPTAGTAYLS